MNKKIIYALIGIIFLTIFVVLIFLLYNSRNSQNGPVVNEPSEQLKNRSNYKVSIDLTGSIEAYYIGSLNPNTNKVNWQNMETNEQIETENIYAAFLTYLEVVSSLNVDEVSFDLDMDKLLQSNNELRKLLAYDQEFKCLFTTDEYTLTTIECEQNDDYFLIEFYEE